MSKRIIIEAELDAYFVNLVSFEHILQNLVIGEIFVLVPRVHFNACHWHITCCIQTYESIEDNSSVISRPKSLECIASRQSTSPRARARSWCTRANVHQKRIGDGKVQNVRLDTRQSFKLEARRAPKTESIIWQYAPPAPICSIFV